MPKKREIKGLCKNGDGGGRKKRDDSQGYKSRKAGQWASLLTTLQDGQDFSIWAKICRPGVNEDNFRGIILFL